MTTRKPKTKKATDAPATAAAETNQPAPKRGGSYVRGKDGALTLRECTKPAPIRRPATQEK